jgi:predicted ATPase
MPEREDRISEEDMLDLLSGLVNKSLVSIELGEDYRFIRYFMLEAIKEYAGGKLQEESDDKKRHLLFERHVRFYNQYLVRAEPKFRTRERDTCIEEVRREYANLRSALQWSYSNPQAPFVRTSHGLESLLVLASRRQAEGRTFLAGSLSGQRRE